MANGGTDGAGLVTMHGAMAFQDWSRGRVVYEPAEAPVDRRRAHQDRISVDRVRWVDHERPHLEATDAAVGSDQAVKTHHGAGLTIDGTVDDDVAGVAEVRQSTQQRGRSWAEVRQWVGAALDAFAAMSGYGGQRRPSWDMHGRHDWLTWRHRGADP